MNNDNDTDIDISVVFATRNRATQLAATLEAYRHLDTSGISWELIVVDSASSDETPAVLDRAHDLPLARCFVAERGQNNARNAAFDRLRGALVVFTDDDVIPAPDCLQAYHAAAARWPREAVFGARIEPRFPQGTPDWMYCPYFEFSSTAFARYAPADQEGAVSRHPYGPSFAIRREALGDQRFPTHLGPRNGAYAMGGEGHLLRRLRAQGWAYIYVPSASVEHVIRRDQIRPQWLVQRANKKGRGRAHLPSSKRARHLFWRGVSLRLWLAAARATLRYHGLGPFVSARRQTRYGITYELRRGEIQERLQHQNTATAD